MRMLHFVDTAGSDETFVISDQVKSIRVSDANTVIVYFDSQGILGSAGVNLGWDDVTLTATANSAVVALRLADYMAASGPSVLTIKAATGPFTEVSAVAYHYTA